MWQPVCCVTNNNDELKFTELFIPTDLRHNMVGTKLSITFDLSWSFKLGSKQVEEYDESTGEYIIYCLNFIIEKYNNTKVNFKSMSGGEKKIATMLRTLFNRCYKINSNYRNIILIDNISKEIYYKLQMK